MISVKKLLEGKQNNRILALAPDAMVIDALELMTKENVGAVMVVENEKLVGIFSERDYARKGIIMGRKAKSTPLTEVMTSNVFTVTPDMNMEDCMQLFSDKRIRHLPVVHDSDLLGMLSIGDIVTAIIVEQKEHIQFLEKYISS
ncbi:MAG: CBS domain-containing protein [Saprospiraceae bacterium]|jgi:CBS domain-containing protein|nr:CBS domain-containing protein [Candidatus Opimibacter skivensis]MBL0005961.1 CBS domain-containing protein [Candidatus Opimibacter skivensis]HQW25902.1 CBS domain-containing protein [Saprospiraceae bacterium]